MKRHALVSCAVLLIACRVLNSGITTEYRPPDDIQTARDAAVTFVRDHYSDASLPDDLNWAGANTTPCNLTGSMSYEFTSGEWWMTIDHDIVAPEEIIYNVTILNTDSGFEWTGTVNPFGEVIDNNGGTEPATNEYP